MRKAQSERRRPVLSSPARAGFLLAPKLPCGAFAALLHMNPDLTASSVCSSSKPPPTRRDGRLPTIRSARRRSMRGCQRPATPWPASKRGWPTRSDKRRAEEKEVAAVQTRLAKYKDQLLEVKTNREYRRCSTKSRPRRTTSEAREDRILEIMMETDELNAAIKKSEAELKTAEKEIAAERAVARAEIAGAAGRNRQDDRRARKRSSPRSIAHVLAIFETDRQRPQGRRRRGGQATGCARSATCGCARRCSTKSEETTRSSSATAAGGFSISPAKLRSLGARFPGVTWPIVAYIDGGARGNPGPAGYGVRIEDEQGALDRTSSTASSARHQQRRRVQRAARRARVRAAARPPRRPHQVGFGAARQTDARRVPGEERRAAAAVSAGALACARTRAHRVRARPA